MENKTNEETLEVTYDGDPFTMFPNDLLINSDIHPNTRLLYGIIKHFITIPDFVLYKSTLIKALGLNENTFDKYWGQLKELGYLEQTKKHINGRYKYSYKLHSSSSKIQDPKIWGVVQDPKKQGLEKQPPCNLGVFNNNDFNNTDLNNTKEILDANEPSSIYQIQFTENQERDINSLLQAIASQKIKTTKESLYKYLIKLANNDFKDSYGKPIKSLYGYIMNRFSIKSKNDEEEKQMLQELADKGNLYAEEVLSKYY